MSVDQIVATPVGKPAAKDCALFMWGMWVMLREALRAVDAWGSSRRPVLLAGKSRQPDLFRDDADGQRGLGHWVRQNSEFCPLATRGSPNCKSAAIRQGITERRRQHSPKARLRLWPNRAARRRSLGGVSLGVWARPVVAGSAPLAHGNVHILASSSNTAARS